MSSNHQSSSLKETVPVAGAALCAPSNLAADGLARRRMLLSGLGRGSVVLAAASVPMRSLATTYSGQRTKTNGNNPVWATVSGCHSAVGSRAPAETLVSKGYGCGHYQTSKNNWIGYNSNSKNDVSCVNKTFVSIFTGATSTYKSNTCYDIVKNHPTSPECRWVVAYLNAQKCYADTTKNYPYSCPEIQDMYTNPTKYGATIKTDCESFFSNFCESES